MDDYYERKEKRRKDCRPHALFVLGVTNSLNHPLVEVRCRYKHPARFDDEITIRTRLAQIRTSLLRFQYELVRKSDGRLLAEGESVHVVVGRDMKTTPLTGKYRDALCAAAGLAPSAT